MCIGGGGGGGGERKDQSYIWRRRRFGGAYTESIFLETVALPCLFLLDLQDLEDLLRYLTTQMEGLADLEECLHLVLTLEHPVALVDLEAPHLLQVEFPSVWGISVFLQAGPGLMQPAQLLLYLLWLLGLERRKWC